MTQENESVVSLADAHQVRLVMAWLQASLNHARVLWHATTHNHSLQRSLARLMSLKRQAIRALGKELGGCQPVYLVTPHTPSHREGMPALMEQNRLLIRRARQVSKTLQDKRLIHMVSYWIAALQMEVETAALTWRRLR